MPEYIMQGCIAICYTVAFAVAIVTIITDFATKLPSFQRKPFNCMYCMTWWVAMIVCIVMFNDTNVAFAAIPVVQILAYAFFQKVL